MYAHASRVVAMALGIIVVGLREGVPCWFHERFLVVLQKMPTSAAASVVPANGHAKEKLKIVKKKSAAKEEPEKVFGRKTKKLFLGEKEDRQGGEAHPGVP